MRIYIFIPWNVDVDVDLYFYIMKFMEVDVDLYFALWILGHRRGFKFPYNKFRGCRFISYIKDLVDVKIDLSLCT